MSVNFLAHLSLPFAQFVLCSSLSSSLLSKTFHIFILFFRTTGPISTVDDLPVAKIIVFSLLKNRKHQEFQQLVIPNIVISLTDFQISMHDTVSDILLGSYPLQIIDVETESLRIETAISLQRN